MGFLGMGNYNKPGPGVSKDDPQKIAPVRFFEIFLRKFWKLVQVNLLFAIPMTIAMVLFWFLINMFEVQASPMFTLNPAMYIALIPMIFVSPFVAGLTMITRNFTREEHAFIWTDFIKAVKSNFKLFMLNGVICYAAFTILSVAIQYYNYQSASNGFFYVPLALCVMLSVLFLFAQYYMPTVLITFDLKYRQALKNSFLLGVLGMGRNFLLTIGLAALLVGLFVISGHPLAFFVVLVLLVFIVYAFWSFLVNFATYPIIKKYMITPQFESEEDKEKAKDGENSEKEASLSFWEELTEEEDDDSYVYVNGRMMKRSELKENNE